MTFSQRIAAIRKQQKLTQEKFGELFDVSQRTVAFWESGQRMPSNTLIAEIANRLGVSIDYLMGLSDEPKIKEPAISDDELRNNIMKRISALPAPVLEKVLELAEAILSNPGPGKPAAAAPDSSDQADL